MASTKAVARTTDHALDMEQVLRDAKEFALAQKQVKILNQRMDSLKKGLSDVIEQYGETDDKGHIVLPLPVPVEGFVSLVRQKKVSKTLNDEKAEQILKKKNLEDRCYELIPVLDEDEVMAAFYEGLLTEREIDQMFPSKITWAFVPTKE